MPREAFGVERCGSDHDLQVRPPREELLQIAQQEVDVETALVCLVDNDGVVGGERAVALGLRQQDAVGHQLDVGIGHRMVGEAHLVPDRGAQRCPELARDAFSHRACSDAPRLCMPDQTAHATTGGEADLGQLRGLARPGFPADDQHRMRADGRRDFIGALRNRQFGRVGDGRLGCDSGVPPRTGSRDVRRNPCNGTLVVRPQALNPRPQPGRIHTHHIGQQRDQRPRRIRHGTSRARDDGRSCLPSSR